jgi:hypothetical protein
MATGTGCARVRRDAVDGIDDMARTSVSGGWDDPSGLHPGLICSPESIADIPKTQAENFNGTLGTAIYGCVLRVRRKARTRTYFVTDKTAVAL